MFLATLPASTPQALQQLLEEDKGNKTASNTALAVGGGMTNSAMQRQRWAAASLTRQRSASVGRRHHRLGNAAPALSGGITDSATQR